MSSAEPPLPVVVADNGVWVFADTRRVAVCKKAPDRGPDPEHIEIVFTDEPPTRLLLCACCDPDRPGVQRYLRSADAGQRMRMIPQICEFLIPEQAPLSG